MRAKAFSRLLARPVALGRSPFRVEVVPCEVALQQVSEALRWCQEPNGHIGCHFEMSTKEETADSGTSEEQLAVSFRTGAMDAGAFSREG